jgi:choline dehydrogenase-like flavoprotein
MRLETNGNAREVSKVIVERNGVREEYSGDIVVVSCGAVNSSALLLRSANDSHPNGLANGSDVVGRHYMGHINSVLMALSKCPNPTVFQKTLAINDFYLGSKDWKYPMGHISFVGKLDADTLKAGAPAIAPGWTLDLMAKHSLDFWLTSEDLPDPEGVEQWHGPQWVARSPDYAGMGNAGCLASLKPVRLCRRGWRLEDPTDRVRSDCSSYRADHRQHM